MFLERIRSFLLYCTLTKDEYNGIRPRIWRRNMRILRITSILSSCIGGLFLLINLLTHAEVWRPYLFLLCGSLLVFLFLILIDRKKANELLEIMTCYVEMVMVCLYAGYLSVQQSNYAIPATSIIVFIAVLPMTIDDRPLRMYGFMLCETALYLVFSRFLKSPAAFKLDVLNATTFCVVGMILYSVICIRNVRELHQGLRVEHIQKSVISSLATVVEERDENTGSHITRTEVYVTGLIARMRQHEKYADISDEFFNNVILAAPMHDIGKIHIPDAILNKPGRLTPEEFEIMKQHTVYGAEIIRKTLRDVEDESYYRIARNIAKSHHERYDGTGYPDGIRGEDIPLEARIMALADVYDALVSERVYKKPFSKADSRKIIEEGCGTQFDPVLAKLFLQAIDK